MRKLLFGLLLGALPALVSAQVKISQMPPATTPLTGSEVTACVQAGVTDKCTVQSIANLNSAGNAATATALQTTPSQCTGGLVSTGVAANGNANCVAQSGGVQLNSPNTWTALQTFGSNISIGGVTAAGATGLGDVVFSLSPTLITPNLGTPTTLTLTNATGLPVSGILGLGTFATQNYATPPPIGGTTPAAGAFTTGSFTGNLTTNVTGSTQCLHVNSAGLITGAGFDCGAGGGGTTAFAGLTTTPSTNTTSAMIVGTGASLTISGSGSITGSPINLLSSAAGGVAPSGSINQLYTSAGTGAPPAWQSGITLTGLTADTTPALADLFLIYSQSATATQSVTGTNLFSIMPAINLTASGSGGVIPSGVANQIYTSNGASPPGWQSGVALTGMATDSSPALADLFMIYSQSASATEAVTGTALSALFGGGTAAFSALTGGTNTTAAMVVGTGASLAASGSGSITATAFTGTLPIANGGLNTSTAPTNGQIPVSNAGGTAYVPTTMHYDTGFTFAGLPANSQVFLYFVPDRQLTIPASATGSTCSAKVAATASTTLTLYKNGSSVGTAVWAISGTTCSFTMASPASWNGTTDTLEIDGPATADATLATIGVVFKGTTTSP